jgi:hypothetical protein
MHIKPNISQIFVGGHLILRLINSSSSLTDNGGSPVTHAESYSALPE